MITVSSRGPGPITAHPSAAYSRPARIFRVGGMFINSSRSCRQARCDLPQHLSPNAQPSGRWKDADAHQFEVATEPVSSNVGSEGLGDTIGPPLAVVAGVSVGKADERVIEVGAHETESVARGVLPPNAVQPVLESRRVAEHLVIKGPDVYRVGVGNGVVTLETKWHSQ